MSSTRQVNFNMTEDVSSLRDEISALEFRLQESESQLTDISQLMLSMKQSLDTLITISATERSEANHMSSTPNRVTQRFSSTPVDNNVRPPSKGILKSKDLDSLKMEDLSSVHSQALRKSFFEQIKLVGSTDQDQVDIALTKMEKPMRIFLVDILRKKGLPINLENLEKAVAEEYPGPQSMADAVRELHQLEYNIEENPRTFYHHFKTKFNLMCQTFPSDTPPHRSPVFKDIIMRQLPVPIQKRLSIFKTEGYSEEMFLAEVEKEKMAAKLRNEISDCGYVNQISQPPKEDYQNQSQKNNTNMRFRKGAISVPPCRYCQNGDCHLVKDCPRNPPFRSCFDCLSTNHGKGNVNCPYTYNRMRNDVNRPLVDEENDGSKSVRSKRSLSDSM